MFFHVWLQSIWFKNYDPIHLRSYCLDFWTVQDPISLLCHSTPLKSSHNLPPVGTALTLIQCGRQINFHSLFIVQKMKENSKVYGSVVKTAMMSSARHRFRRTTATNTRMPFNRMPTSRLPTESHTITIWPLNEIDLEMTMTQFMTLTLDMQNQVKLMCRSPNEHFTM